MLYAGKWSGTVLLCIHFNAGQCVVRDRKKRGHVEGRGNREGEGREKGGGGGGGGEEEGEEGEGEEGGERQH